MAETLNLTSGQLKQLEAIFAKYAKRLGVAIEGNELRSILTGAHRYMLETFGSAKDIAALVDLKVSDSRKLKILDKVIPKQGRLALKFAQQRGAFLVGDWIGGKRAELRNMVAQASMAHEHPFNLAERLYNNFSTMNRDWRRLAATETAFADNNGYIATVLEDNPQGKAVYGSSAPGACKYCLEHINGKLLQIVDPKKIKELDWDTHLWVGKNNHGRSWSENKIVDGNLVKRSDGEIAKPVIPAHPYCRCRWVEISMTGLAFEIESGKEFTASTNFAKWYIKDPEMVKKITIIK